MDFYFFILVYINSDNHLIFFAKVGSLSDINDSITKTLAFKVSRNNIFRTIHNVLGDLVTRHQTKTLLQFLSLTLFHSGVINARDARLLAQIEKQPSFIATCFFHLNLNFRE